MLQRNRQGILVTEQRGTKLIQVGLSLPASERVSTDCILIIHLELLSLTKKVFWWEKGVWGGKATFFQSAFPDPPLKDKPQCLLLRQSLEFSDQLCGQSLFQLPSAPLKDYLLPSSLSAFKCTLSDQLMNISISSDGLSNGHILQQATSEPHMFPRISSHVNYFTSSVLPVEHTAIIWTHAIEQNSFLNHDPQSDQDDLAQWLSKLIQNDCGFLQQIHTYWPFPIVKTF